jgi:hypothetical protein
MLSNRHEDARRDNGHDIQAIGRELFAAGGKFYGTLLVGKVGIDLT